ncbi:hypothetical protein MJ561_13375 [Klebsiella pneumoniae]|nr:hypothetical protein MJ561_13375 [Klebsiella pneumoniae]
MNKFAALLAAGMLLSGCVYNKVSTGAEQLQHHRFVLTSTSTARQSSTQRPAAGAKLR